MRTALVWACLLSGGQALAEEGFKATNVPPAIRDAWNNTFELVTLKPATEHSSGFSHMGTVFPVRKELVGGTCYVMMATAAHVVEDQVRDLGRDTQRHTVILGRNLNPRFPSGEGFLVPEGRGGFFSKPKLKKSAALQAFEAEAEEAKLKLTIVDQEGSSRTDVGAFLVRTKDVKVCQNISPLALPKASECSSLTAPKTKSYMIGFPKTHVRPSLAPEEGKEAEVVKSYSTGVLTGTNGPQLGTTADAIQGNSGGPILAVSRSGAAVAVSVLQQGAVYHKDKGEVYNGDDRKLIPHAMGASCAVFVAEVERLWGGFQEKIQGGKLEHEEAPPAGTIKAQ